MVSLSAIIFFVILGSAFAATVPEEKSPKVVNGTEADIAEFPFMVSLRRNGGHSCGGSLINSEWILTAAHCLGSPVLNYSVQFANTIISRDGTHVAQVVEKIVHEGYMPSNQYIHDIGLVRLEDPIKSPLSDFSVRLPLSGSYFTTGTPALLTGWGLNGTDGVIMPHLQKVDLQIFSAFDCNELHRSTVHYTNICGGVPEGGKGQCSGDSGGPLLVDGVQVGIVSWSVKPCTVAPYPGVYTGVSHYINWISENTGIDFKLSLFLRARSNESAD